MSMWQLVYKFCQCLIRFASDARFYRAEPELRVRRKALVGIQASATLAPKIALDI